MATQVNAVIQAQNNMQQKIAQFKEQLTELDALLKQETGIEQFNDHMVTLQQTLRATPHIVDTLEPEEIGCLVAAMRRKMTDDLLSQKAKTPRKRKSVKPKKVSLKSDDLDATDFGDLF